MLMPIVGEVLAQAGLPHDQIGFVCSGSSDYLAGQAFSFVMTLDSVGPWPPISESHVDMDGAWALYEAWVKMQTGTVDTALVYSYGKSSPGDIRRVLTRQLDPYYLGPLWPDSVAMAALQARACLDAGRHDRGRDGRGGRPQPPGRRRPTPTPSSPSSPDADALLAEPMFVDPLRRPRLPAGHRRRRRHRAGRRRRGPRAVRAPGLDPRHRPPHRAARPRACAT